VTQLTATHTDRPKERQVHSLDNSKDQLARQKKERERERERKKERPPLSWLDIQWPDNVEMKIKLNERRI
jgi:hypothetical protein